MDAILISIGVPLIVGAVNFTAKKIYESITGREKTFFWKD